MIGEILEGLSVFLALVMTAYLVRHYLFTIVVLNSPRKQRTVAIDTLVYTPSVSILIPAHNEERVIRRILKRVTELTYPRDKLQVIVIDDASTDDTGRIAEQYSKTHDFIKVIHRSMGEGRRGKASALNFGCKYAEGEIIFCFDADYYPQLDILEQLAKKFIDPQVGVVQGRVTVLNEPVNAVTRLVALERIGGYRVDQQARERLGLITQFGGTVGGIRRSLLERLGGWDESMMAEDTDLTFRVYLAGYRVCYVGNAESYEEAVESWRCYWKQRYRWARGHMQCAFKHSFAVMRSKTLGLREKIDGVLLLNVYFVPIFTLFSLFTSVALFFFSTPLWSGSFWILTLISLYNSMGNFAPFFEVGVGTYLDGRTRASWLIPLLMIVFVFNIPICTKAFADLAVSKVFRAKHGRWERTFHSGNGNSYIMN